MTQQDLQNKMFNKVSLDLDTPLSQFETEIISECAIMASKEIEKIKAGYEDELLGFKKSFAQQKHGIDKRDMFLAHASDMVASYLNLFETLYPAVAASGKDSEYTKIKEWLRSYTDFKTKEQ